jgi:prolyl 4-hydroxylase
MNTAEASTEQLAIAQAEAVRAWVARVPGMFQVPARGLEMFVLPAFLGQEECDGLIRMIDANRVPSRLLAPTDDPEFRTSESCNLDPHDRLVQRIEHRIEQVTGIPKAFSETIQGQRYAVGQQFKAHHDFFFASQEYWEAQEKAGGQRTWTVMMFLNEPEEGGQTFFPEAQVRITPRRGNLLAWNNLDGEGRPNARSIHQGLPVLAGVKYVITKWYRARHWTPPPPAAIAS